MIAKTVLGAALVLALGAMMAASASAKLAANKLAANGISPNGTSLDRHGDKARFDTKAVRVGKVILPDGTVLPAR